MGLSASFYPQKILPVLAMGARSSHFQFLVFSGLWLGVRPVRKIAVGFLRDRMNASAESLQPASCQLLANNFSRYTRQEGRYP
jgi:hypothetical protein